MAKSGTGKESGHSANEKIKIFEKKKKIKMSKNFVLTISILSLLHRPFSPAEGKKKKRAFLKITENWLESYPLVDWSVTFRLQFLSL